MRDLFENLNASHLLRDVRQLVAAQAPAEKVVPLVEEFSTTLQTTVDEIERRFYYYSRVASLGLLAATIVHEVRNKAVVIGRLISLLQRQFSSELNSHPQLANALQLADIALDSLDRLATTFAPLATRAPRKRKQSELREVVEQCVAMRNPDIESRHITVEVRPTIAGAVDIDPGELSAVIINFIDNALYWVSYAPQNQRRIVIDAKPIGRDRIEVQVHDSGPGVTKGDEERIFWPGVTSKPEGLGMGLTVASEIVSQHGGDTKLVVPGALGGATFAFDLPLTK
jgi:signal transduction histidine kinase